jgi:shikimate dehydrogenase
MPLKKEAAALATKVDDIVTLTGVANTLVRVQDEFNAYNTDVYGITQALKECFDSSPKDIAILGSGATAISALVAIYQKAPTAEITVYVRDKSRAHDVVELSAKLKLNLVVAELRAFTSGKDLVISTIPNLALSAMSVETNHGWLLNTNYQGIDSQFTSSFQSNRAVDGRVMLLWQALGQIRIFVNGSPETELPDEQALFKAMAAAL